MSSESEDVFLEDSDDSLLDIKELNDLEFDIPHVPPPSLESVLGNTDVEEGSDSASTYSLQSNNIKLGSLLCHKILQGLSQQISAGDKVHAGVPTVITASSKYVTIGTSHGFVLNFDSEQNLSWCYHDTNAHDQGAVSAMSMNIKSTRLLIGYERGFISMVDATSGDVIRRLPDAHAPHTAVLHLRFTILSNLALCGDSSGCVFSLGFNRRLGVRTWDSRCLFSGSRGEVCVFEPLQQAHQHHLSSNYVLVALATLSKIIVISIRPRLKVLFSQQLPRISTSLPLISWQLLPVGPTLQPVLAWGRGGELNYTRVVTHAINNSRVRLIPLCSVQLSYSLLAVNWLGTRYLALLDTDENLRLIDAHTRKEVEIVELANIQLVYGSAHFKGLAVGGGVSEAFALAGERACYGSLACRGDQLLVLGTRTVHLIKLRSWSERILYLTEQNRWTEALKIAAEEGKNKEIFTTNLLYKFINSLNENTLDKDSLTAAIKCCAKLKKTDILCNELLNSVLNNQISQEWYYELLTEYIIDGLLTNINPSVSQSLVTYLEKKGDNASLESVLLALDVSCLDLHQTLSVCRKMNLYDAWIHTITKTMKDYTRPLIELLPGLKGDDHHLGNIMLVYVSSCLAGLGYPSGEIPDEDKSRVKHDILRCLETVHSINSSTKEPTYPYLRALLEYNTRECLNVINLAFTEAEFCGEMGLLQRQRLVQILVQIVVPPNFSAKQLINLACFITNFVTSGNLLLENEMLDRVIRYLIECPFADLSLRDHYEREQAWLDLLRYNAMDHYPRERLLQLALETKCYKVAEFLYELHHNYSNIFTCYLSDVLRRQDIFNYILTYVNEYDRHIEQQFFENIKQLMQIDSKRTCHIISEHFLNRIEDISEILSDDLEVHYAFLKSLIARDVKLPSQLCEKYLEILSQKDKSEVCNFLKMSVCKTEEALSITRKYEVHAGTALLLEREGRWTEALNHLLQNGLIDESVNLCIRAIEHLDSDEYQNLWLTLLTQNSNFQKISMRQILHLAAPHVPPPQLLNLITNANFGDIKLLLQGMIMDCIYDIHILIVTFNLLGKDLHHGLAKALSSNTRSISITCTNCLLCQKPLSLKKGLCDDQIAVWGCGHCFHKSCLEVEIIECITMCPLCSMKSVITTAYCLQRISKIVQLKEKQRFINERPDLEGHF